MSLKYDVLQYLHLKVACPWGYSEDKGKDKPLLCFIYLWALGALEMG